MNFRAQMLKDKAQFPLTLPQQKQFETLDILMVEGMKLAEKKCRKLRMGGVQWTPQVSENFSTIQVLRMIIKKKQGGKVGMSLIRRTLSKTDLPKNVVNKTVHELQLMEADLHIERRRYKKNHITHRKEWLHSQQAKMYDRGKTTIASKLKATQNREDMRRISSRIRIALAPFQARGVTKINYNGVEVTTHEEIVAGFKEEAIKRGKQTENTPFMQQPLLGEFGFRATNANANSVLNGTYVPTHNIDPYVMKLLPHFAIPENVRDARNINMELKTQEYTALWKNKNEYTGSGPSGLHYGHFKAMCWNKQNALFHTNMANIPLLTGYSPL